MVRNLASGRCPGRARSLRSGEPHVRSAGLGPGRHPPREGGHFQEDALLPGTPSGRREAWGPGGTSPSAATMTVTALPMVPAPPLPPSPHPCLAGPQGPEAAETTLLRKRRHRPSQGDTRALCGDGREEGAGILPSCRPQMVSGLCLHDVFLQPGWRSTPAVRSPGRGFLALLQDHSGLNKSQPWTRSHASLKQP